MESIPNNQCMSLGCACDESSHTKVWLRYIRERRWNRQEKHRLLNKFSCPVLIYERAADELDRFLNKRRRKIKQCDLRGVERDLAWLSQDDASLITYGSSLYPTQLKQIDDPPLALFALGNVNLINEPQISIVGSRRPTPIGAKLAEEIAHDLSKLGLIITSGMALGIDGLAHSGALAGGGATIAVLGCGLDVVYPARHRVMYQNIREKGLLLSEYPIGSKPTKYSFPERNRIVSGLSFGVVIIEAASKSGTLITARLALEQNKEVMVLPGAAVSKQYEGSHRLIKDGAALVTCADDVLHTLNYVLSDFAKTGEVELIEVVDDGPLLGLNSSSILGLIGAEPVSVDEIIFNSGLTPTEVSSMLLLLELEGKVILDDSGGYINLG